MENEIVIEINKNEYERLLEIEKKYETIKLDESVMIANNMTNNAINVNNASKEKVIEIKDISDLTNKFIDKSRQIEEKSSTNYKTSQLSSTESENIILLIKKLSDTINSLDTIFEHFTTTIDSLTVANKEITELVSINDQISIQTNLLSLNAKVEAARAGDYGKGFSIVADEVKKLAASSKHSTQEIGKKIDDISNMTKSAKEHSDKSNELIDNSVSISLQAIEKLNYLIKLSQQNKQDSTEVQSIVDNQLKDSDTIQVKISDLLDDTKKAIEGSSKNIELGKSLLSRLENS